MPLEVWNDFASSALETSCDIVIAFWVLFHFLFYPKIGRGVCRRVYPSAWARSKRWAGEISLGSHSATSLLVFGRDWLHPTQSHKTSVLSISRLLSLNFSKNLVDYRQTSFFSLLQTLVGEWVKKFFALKLILNGAALSQFRVAVGNLIGSKPRNRYARQSTTNELAKFEERRK